MAKFRFNCRPAELSAVVEALPADIYNGIPMEAWDAIATLAASPAGDVRHLPDEEAAAIFSDLLTVARAFWALDLVFRIECGHYFNLYIASSKG